jgi:hypothetical protein
MIDDSSAADFVEDAGGSVPGEYLDARGGLKPEFGTHYTEVANFHKTETERVAALKARKPEDIKFEIELPDTVKVPEGVKVQIDEKDPRLPLVRELALQHGWDQGTVNALATLDARMKIEAHNAEVTRIEAEDKKLGDKVKERKDAVSAWAKGLLDSKTITQDEYEEVRMTAATAAGVTLLEKLIAKSNGSVPGTGGGQQPQPAPEQKPMEQRWYS